jgi:hypothetical protein
MGMEVLAHKFSIERYKQTNKQKRSSTEKETQRKEQAVILN